MINCLIEGVKKHSKTCLIMKSERGQQGQAENPEIFQRRLVETFRMGPLAMHFIARSAPDIPGTKFWKQLLVLRLQWMIYSSWLIWFSIIGIWLSWTYLGETMQETQMIAMALSAQDHQLGGCSFWINLVWRSPQRSMGTHTRLVYPVQTKGHWRKDRGQCVAASSQA